MNHLSFSNSFFQILLQIRGRTSFRHSHPLRFLTQGRLDSHPYNMIHSQLIPEDNFLILIHIDNGSQPSIGQAEKIKKSRDYRSCLMTNCITGCTTIVNSKLIEKLLPLPGYPIVHDWWIGLVAGSYGEIGYIEAPLIKYRQHGNNQIGYVTTKTIFKFTRGLRRHLITNHIQILEVLKKRMNVLNPELEPIVDDGIKYLKSILYIS